MDYFKENTLNTHKLWESYGAVIDGIFRVNSSWPDNVWASEFVKKTELYALLDILKKKTQLKFVSWNETQNSVLDSNPELSSIMQLNLMHLKLDNFDPDDSPRTHLKISELTLNRKDEFKAFVDLSMQAFGYEIDIDTLYNACRNPNVAIYLLNNKKTPIATALTYSTRNVTGIYQVSVPPMFQKKGYAQSLMYKVLELAKKQRKKIVTLQASDSGLGLYRKLNFESHGKLTYYKLKN